MVLADESILIEDEGVERVITVIKDVYNYCGGWGDMRHELSLVLYNLMRETLNLPPSPH